MSRFFGLVAAVLLLICIALVWALLDRSISLAYAKQDADDLNRQCLAITLLLEERIRHMRPDDLFHIAKQASKNQPNFEIKQDEKNLLWIESVGFQFSAQGELRDIKACRFK